MVPVDNTNLPLVLGFKRYLRWGPSARSVPAHFLSLFTGPIREMENYSMIDTGL